MKCYVYYKDGTMKDFRPLNPNYEPTSVLTRAAVVDDSDTIRKELIDGTIEDNKGKAFVAMQLRSVDDGKVIYSRSTDESLEKKKCSMAKKIEALSKARKNESVDDDAEQMVAKLQDIINAHFRGGKEITLKLTSTPGQDYVEVGNHGSTDFKVPVGSTANAYIVRDVINKLIEYYY